MSFENVKVVVTGGAKGIGGACVEAFMEGGAKVCILDIDQAGQEFADSLGNDTFFIHCDVSKEDEVNTAFRKIEKKFGAEEVLVNNAGIQSYSTVTETTEEEWDLIMNVNFKSAFLCSKYAIPIMLKKIGSWVGSTKKYFSELQNEVSLYEHENDKEKNLSKNKARDTKDEK